MNLDNLGRHFKSIGARAKVFRLAATFQITSGFGIAQSFRRTPLRIDVLKDRKGECFCFFATEEAPEVEILQAAPKDRHLLLYANDGRRFLCGHDERHWFVAGVEERVSTVRAAKQSLIPTALRRRAQQMPFAEINRRKNELFVRQGEWFFVPVNMDVPENLILRDEPLQRTPHNKPHIVQELYRQGGETVYILSGRAYNEKEFRHLRQSVPDVNVRPNRTMVRNPNVYARGTVRHADHATIRLDGWHQVFLNGEMALSAITFLD
jgi:hypothetical protein